MKKIVDHIIKFILVLTFILVCITLIFIYSLNEKVGFLIKKIDGPDVTKSSVPIPIRKSSSIDETIMGDSIIPRTIDQQDATTFEIQ